jgi:hypothetical protein
MPEGISFEVFVFSVVNNQSVIRKGEFTTEDTKRHEEGGMGLEYKEL